LGPGITRPGVARAQELPAATRDAIRQWSLGVAAAQTAAPLDKGRAAILHWHFICCPYTLYIHAEIDCHIFVLGKETAELVKVARARNFDRFGSFINQDKYMQETGVRKNDRAALINLGTTLQASPRASRAHRQLPPAPRSGALLRPAPQVVAAVALDVRGPPRDPQILDP
jgi:hypothetical protein